MTSKSVSTAAQKANQLSGWHRKSQQERDYHQQIEHFLSLLAQIRAQTELEHAKALALRSHLIMLLMKLFHHHGLDIDSSHQAALMSHNPIHVASLFLDTNQSLYTAKSVALMNVEQAADHMQQLSEQLPTGDALLQWTQFRGGLYRQWLLVGYESQLTDDHQAKLINVQDLRLSCPGYQRAEVREFAKQENISSVSSAFAALAMYKQRVHGIPVTTIEFDLSGCLQHAGHQQLAQFLAVSQTPGQFWQYTTEQQALTELSATKEKGMT
ncbi:MAG: hypothetical protein P1U63_00255 [Coxiellaceae bacterium]|nr:hypothetical protein [Coxiellaceae bacterium]